MRVRHWLMVGSIAVGLVGSFAAGCGGSSDSGPSPDAGNDVTTADVVADTNTVQDTSTADVADAANACVEDASIAQLNPPDASLADGGSSVGLCLGCIKTNCDTELQACADDCPCNNAVAGVIGCVLKGGGLQSCAGPLLGLNGNSQQLGLALGGCLLQGCKDQCAPGLDAGGSKDSGGDAPEDAPDAG